MASSNDTLPRAYLFLENQGRFIRFLFTKARTLLGSADDNDIVIRDPGLLPRHAEIFVAGGEFHLVAVAGGVTQVSGESVHGVRPLRNGEILRFGDIDVLFAQEGRVSENTLQIIIERAGEVPFGVTIGKPIIRVGRSKGDILVDDDDMLPTHVLIENFCSQGVFVIGAQAKGHTLLNGQPLDGRRRLHDGDELRMGSTVFLVSYDNAAAASVDAPRVARAAAPATRTAAPVGGSRHPNHIPAAAPSPPAAASRPAPAARPATVAVGRPTEMVDVSEVQRPTWTPPPPASHIVHVPVAPQAAYPPGYAGEPDDYMPAGSPHAPEPWRPPAPSPSAEPLPAYPDIAAAGDFVGGRHYLPRTYRAGKTQETSQEANWGAAPDKQPRRPSQMNMTTAIPHPARVRQAVEEERQEGTSDPLWYQPGRESKIVDD